MSRRHSRHYDHMMRLNPRWTFGDFVVAPCNAFAYEIAVSVARDPGRERNPLLIHGGEGLGRTHLMHAIGQHISMSSVFVRLVSAESFVFEYLEALSSRRMAEFRRKCLAPAVLLFDDVQHLNGKERMQEELVGILRTLRDRGCQIVLTSDRSPNGIGLFSARLAAQCESGLAVEMEPPDGKTRLRILEHKLRRMSASLPAPIVRFIAENVTTHVRALESALRRTLAYAAMSDGDLDLAAVTYLLRDCTGERQGATLP